MVSDRLSAFFGTFQSSRSIEKSAVVYFVEDVTEFSLRAVDETIVRFRRGEVPDRNNDFAPSVAAFVAEVRRRQGEIDNEAFWEKTAFIEAESLEWRLLCKRRGRSMPQVERGAKIGWYVPKDEVAELTPQMIEDERALLEHRDPRPVIPQLRKI